MSSGPDNQRNQPPAVRSAGQSFPACYRVKKQRDFERIYQRDVFAADSVLVIRGCDNGLSHPRLGLSVSRKVGPAVVRNRWKRCIREAFRRQFDQLPAGVDLVVRPRKGARLDSHQIARSLPQLARRIDQQLAKSRQQAAESGPPKAALDRQERSR